MNPCTWLAAGGAGAGGAGAGAGKQGSGDASAEGSSKEGDPNDGQKNVDGRDGKSGSGKAPCPSHPGNSGTDSAGDPVDVATGFVFTLPEADVDLPGPLPFEFSRQYNSGRAGYDVGLGFGWSHSLSRHIEVGRRFIRMWDEDGTAVTMRPLAIGEQYFAEHALRFTHAADGYVVDNDEIWLEFKQEAESGTRFLLTAIRDRNSHTISLMYDERTRLIKVRDSAGRDLQFDRDAAGRLIKISVLIPDQGSLTLFSYSYDAAGDLVAATDADGYATRYTYRNHLLTAQRDAADLTFHYRYDREDRCTETWGDYPDRVDPSLASDVPAYLADAETRAKGILHCKLTYGSGGFREVVDSVRVRRYQSNTDGTCGSAVVGSRVTTRTFDAHGHVASVTDPSDLRRTWERDERGRVVRFTDRSGRVFEYERDAGGRVTRERDPAGNVLERAFDKYGNQLFQQNPDGSILSYKYQNGFLIETVGADGGVTRGSWDAHGNIVEVIQPNGAVWRATYDFLGRRTSITNPLGETRQDFYTARGDRIETRLSNGAVIYRTFNGVRRIVRLAYPDGRVFGFEYGGYHRIVRAIRPDGAAVEFSYDRENQPRFTKNAKGEQHEFVANFDGQLRKEVTFDGRQVSYTYNLGGQIKRVRDSSGSSVDFEYDAEGELVERVFGDDSAHTFEYDILGNVVSANSPDCAVRLERDPVGRVIREVSSVRGDSYEVRSEYDVAGNVRRIASSLGHQLDREYDVMGMPTRETLDGKDVLRYAKDVTGRVTDVQLPSGGSMHYLWGDQDHLLKQTVTPLGGGAVVDTGEPEWIGGGRGDTSVGVTYGFSLGGRLDAKTEDNGKRTDYEYDTLGQLTSTALSGVGDERFNYDLNGNLYEATVAGQARAYGPGDRLLTRGAWAYEWDQAGRLKAKVRQLAADTERWEFSWSGAGELSTVVRPDGVRAEYFYDAFGRRVTKNVYAGRDPSAQLLTSTRYVWGDELLLHEVRTRFNAAGESDRTERTYVHREPDDFVLGHRDITISGDLKTVGPWCFYVNDVGGFPAWFVDAEGTLTGETDRGAFGSVRASRGTESPVRFAGQFADDETGLYYNRHRYYDPELGRYISPDPIGLYAGFNLYRYVENSPVMFADPDGLGCLVTITGSGNSAGVTTTKGSKNTDGPQGTGWQQATTPSVAKAVADTQQKELWKPGTCAEPAAFDDFLKKAKAQPGNKNLSDAELLKQIPPGGIDIEHHGNKTKGKRHPCQNCRQMLWELGIDPDTDPRIKGNPRKKPGPPLDPTKFGKALK